MGSTIFKINAPIAAVLFLACLQPLPATADDSKFLSRQEVGVALADVLGPLARRKLTPDEIVAVTEEFIPLLGDSECTARCIEILQYNQKRVAPVKEIPGSTLDVRTRHDYISQLYFSPTQSGSLIQRLSAEADPVMVVENAPQRLMTRSDVVAVMNLFHFARESGPPNGKSFKERDVIAAADTLNGIYGSAEYVMPRHLPLAAVYWCGLETQWSAFSEAQRAQVRAYFASRKVRRPLTSDLYVALLGLSADQASSFYMAEYEEALSGIVSRQFDVIAKIEEMRAFNQIWLPN